MSGCAGSMGASVTLHVTSLACGLIGGGWRVLMHGHATDLSPQCSAPSSSALPDAGCPKSSGPALLPHTLLIPRPSGPAPLPLRRPHPGLQRQQHPGRPEPQPPPHPEAAGSRSAGARQMPRIWEAQVAATQVLGPPLLGCEMLPAGQGNWQLAQADCKALLVHKAAPAPPPPPPGRPRGGRGGGARFCAKPRHKSRHLPPPAGMLQATAEALDCPHLRPWLALLLPAVHHEVARHPLGAPLDAQGLLEGCRAAAALIDTVVAAGGSADGCWDTAGAGCSQRHCCAWQRAGGRTAAGTLRVPAALSDTVVRGSGRVGGCKERLLVAAGTLPVRCRGSWEAAAAGVCTSVASTSRDDAPAPAEPVPAAQQAPPVRRLERGLNIFGQPPVAGV